MGGAINSVSDTYSVGGAFLAEMMMTMLLCFVVMSAVDKNNGHPERVNMKQSHGIATIGGCIRLSRSSVVCDESA